MRDSERKLLDLGEAIHFMFDKRTPEEILSRVADEIRMRVPLDKRDKLLHDFFVHVRDGYAHIAHMPGFEDTK